ncbi:MAG: hypothetical protein JWO48_925 [Bryobacterales bacterium]|nr:hypothetical protein [Bryobacterales bacterium]
MKAGLGILFLVGCFLFYYGGTMLLLVPGVPGEAYFNWDRVQYGGIPVVIGLGALLLAGRLWARTRIGGWQRRFGAPGAVVLGAVVVTIGYSVLILLAARHQR